MKTAEEEVKELSKNLKMDQIVKSLLIRILESRDKEICKESNEFILDIAKLFPGSDDLGYDGLSWSIDDFKDAIERVRKDENKITRHACAEIANTTKTDYGGDAIVKLRNNIHQAIMNTDTSIDLKIDNTPTPEGICKQCGVNPAMIDTCLSCDQETVANSKRMFELMEEGHNSHCVNRMVWGDGECECGKGG